MTDNLKAIYEGLAGKNPALKEYGYDAFAKDMQVPENLEKVYKGLANKNKQLADYGFENFQKDMFGEPQQEPVQNSLSAEQDTLKQDFRQNPRSAMGMPVDTAKQVVGQVADTELSKGDDASNLSKGWQAGVQNLKGGLKYLGGAIGESLDKIGGEDDWDFDNRLMESARKNFESAPQGEGIWYELGSFAPQMIGIAAASVAAPITGGTSLAALPGIIGGANIAMLTGSAAGSAMHQYDQYKEEKGQKSNDLARLGVGVASGAAEYLAERIGLDRYMPKGSMTRAFTRFLSNNDDVAEKIAKDALKKNPSLSGFAKRTGKNMLEEGTEESITEVGNILIETMYKDKEDYDSFEEIVGRVGSAFKGGAMMGGVLSPITYGADIAYQRKMEGQQGQNDPIEKFVKDYIDESIGFANRSIKWAKENEQDAQIYVEMLDQLQNDPASYLRNELWEVVDLSKEEPDNQRLKERADRLRSYIDYLDNQKRASQKSPDSPQVPTINPEDTAKADIQNTIQTRSHDSGEIVMAYLEGVGPVMVKSGQYENGKFNDPDGQIVYYDQEGNPNIAAQELFSGDVQSFTPEQFAQMEMGRFQQEMERRKLVQQQAVEIEGQLFVNSGQVDEQGNPIIVPLDQNMRPDESKATPISPEQFEQLFAAKQVQQNAVQQGEPEPQVEKATFGKTEYQITVNEDGSSDVLIPNKVDPKKALAEITKHFENNANWQVEPQMETREVPAKDRFSQATTENILTGIKIVPKQIATPVPSQDNKKTEKQGEPKYTFNKENVTKEEVAEMINLAEDPNELNGLRIDNDPELQQMLLAKFPDKAPRLSIAGQQATEAQIKARIRLGKGLDQIQIENSPELQTLLDKKVKELSKTANNVSQNVGNVPEIKAQQPVNADKLQGQQGEMLPKSETAPQGQSTNLETTLTEEQQLQQNIKDTKQRFNERKNALRDELNNTLASEKKWDGKQSINTFAAELLNDPNVSVEDKELITKSAQTIREIQSAHNKQMKAMKGLEITQRKPRSLSETQQRAVDVEAYDPESLIKQYFIQGGKINKAALEYVFGDKSGQRTGKTDPAVEAERKRRISYFAGEGKGKGVDEIAHELWEMYSDITPEATSTDYRDAVINVIQGFNSTTKMAESILAASGQQVDTQNNEEAEIEDEAREIVYNNPSNEDTDKAIETFVKSVGQQNNWFTQEDLLDIIEQNKDKLQENDYITFKNYLNELIQRDSQDPFAEPEAGTGNDIFGEVETGQNQQGQRDIEEVQAEAGGQVKPETPEQEYRRKQAVFEMLQKELYAAENKYQSLKERLENSPEFGNKGQADIFGNVAGADVINFGNNELEQANKVVQNAKKEVDLIRDQVNKLSKELAQAKDKAQNQQDIEFATPIEAALENAPKKAEIAKEEKKVEQNPSEAQKEAGNYQKGHIKVQGFDITIENAKGSTRSGKDQSGKEWSQTMNNTYGYFKRTKGKDGDQIDVFIGNNPETGKIFVVDQLKVDTETAKRVKYYEDYYKTREKNLNNTIKTRIDYISNFRDKVIDGLNYDTIYKVLKENGINDFNISIGRYAGARGTTITAWEVNVKNSTGSVDGVADLFHIIRKGNAVTDEHIRSVAKILGLKESDFIKESTTTVTLRPGTTINLVNDGQAITDINEEFDRLLTENKAEAEKTQADLEAKRTKEFDEHKVMLGFNSEQEAREAYLSNYEEGWQGLGNITEVSRQDFKTWLKDGTRTKEPFADQQNKEQRPKVVDNAIEQDGYGMLASWLPTQMLVGNYSSIRELAGLAGVELPQQQKQFETLLKEQYGGLSGFDQKVNDILYDKVKAYLDKVTGKANEKNINFVENQNDGIPEPVSQGKRREENEEGERVVEKPQASIGGIKTALRDAQAAGKGLSFAEQARITEEALIKYAKENDIWYPLESLTDFGTPLPSGNENEVYYNEKDGFVYKVNNLSLYGNVATIVERLEKHNKIFPETSYEIIGFTGSPGRSLFPVLKQKYVDSVRNARPEEIKAFMEKMGFKQKFEVQYSDGETMVGDLYPRNVLVDASGDLYVIDNIIKPDPFAEAAKQDEGKQTIPDSYGAYLLDKLDELFSKQFPNRKFDRQGIIDSWKQRANERSIDRANDALEDTVVEYYKPEERQSIRIDLRKQQKKQDVTPLEQKLDEISETVVPHDGWRDSLIKSRSYARRLMTTEQLEEARANGMDWTDAKSIVKAIDDFLSGNAVGKTGEVSSFEKEKTREMLNDLLSKRLVGKNKEDAIEYLNNHLGHLDKANQHRFKVYKESITPKNTGPKEVNVEGLLTNLRNKGEAKLSDNLKDDKEYGADNKIVSKDRYEELKKRMKGKLNNLNAGFDPELLAMGAEMAAYHVEAGARKFGDFAKRMVNDLGDGIKPYLKAIYNAARDLPGMEALESQMDEYVTVKSADIDELIDHKANDNEENIPETKATFIDDVVDNIQKERSNEIGSLPKTIGNVIVESISDKAIIVKGETRPIKDGLKSLGGKWNGKLVGWIFPKTKITQVQKYLNDLNKINTTRREEMNSLTKDRSALIRTPKERFIDAIKERLSNGQRIKNTPELVLIAQSAGFQDIDNIKQLYDIASMALNNHINDRSTEFNPEGITIDQVKEIVVKLNELSELLPTETQRSATQVELQQYSTPPAFAFLVNWAANINSNDRVLEPSAGEGNIAIFAKNAGAQVYVNEWDADRKSLLQQIGFTQVSQVDAKLLHVSSALRDKPITAVIMNPPFSKDVALGNKMDLHAAEKHIDAALSKLENEGRLVAIVGKGMSMDSHTHKQWWDGIKRRYHVRANILVSGDAYTKKGTSFDNRILVIDKNGETSPSDLILTGSVNSYDELADLLQQVPQKPRISYNKYNENTNRNSEEEAGINRRNSQPTLFDTPATDVGSVQRGNTGQSANVDGNTQRHSAGSTGINEAQRQDSNKGTGPRTGGTGTANQRPATSQNRGTNQRTSDSRTPANQDEGKRRLDSNTSQAISENNVVRNKKETVNVSGGYVDYQPEVTIDGAKPHPTKLVESTAMGSVSLPETNYKTSLPQSTIESGALSSAQLEDVILAGNAHRQMLPSQERRGFFLGAGTGYGKGRTIAAIILDNWNKGNKKAVWISKNDKAHYDSSDYWSAVGGDPKKLFSQKNAKNPIKADEGVLLMTYGTLKTRFDKNANYADNPSFWQGEHENRIQQLAQWLGRDFDGVIVFDESHMMANAIEQQSGRGRSKPSQAALAGMELQRLFPKAKIVYSSATGATEVSNLVYAQRLGLWGDGTPFGSPQEFIQAVEMSGVAGMEIIAKDLKAMGLYTAKTLSYEGVGYRNVEHNISNEQKELYNKLARAWQTIYSNIEEAIEINNTNSQGKSAALSAFWGGQQRFFNQIIITMQMPSVIQDIQRKLDEGNAAVIQLVNTGEAQQERALAEAKAESDGEINYEDLDMSPKSSMLEMLRRSFPVGLYQDQLDENGNTIQVPVRDEEGKHVQNPEAVAMRDRLIEQIEREITLPESPLDMILNTFGIDNVAEITGRTNRVVQKLNESGDLVKSEESRTPAHALQDKDDFMDGKKNILVFSNAGGTGASFHADLARKNQKQRSHYVLQAGWQADVAVQGFGRSHRANQRLAPELILPTTNLKSQKRFISSIARRLEQLGALTKGQRDTANQGMFSETDNLEGRYAKQALFEFYQDVEAGRIRGVDMTTLEQQMVIKIYKDNNGVREYEPNVVFDTKKFLNRLMTLEVDLMDNVFDAYIERLEEQIRIAKDSNTYDAGIEQVAALSTRVIDEKIIYTDENTGANTYLTTIELELKNEKRSYDELLKYVERYGDKFQGFIKENNSGRIYGLVRLRKMNADGSSDNIYKRISVITESNIDYFDLREKYVKVPADEASVLWEQEYHEYPDTRKKNETIVKGLILPIWNRLPQKISVKRYVDENGTAHLGRYFFGRDVQSIIDNFDVQSNDFTPSELKKILNEGGTVKLSNGFLFGKTKYQGISVLKISNTVSYRDRDRLERSGAMFVVRSSMTMQGDFFIPMDRAENALPEIIRLYNAPVVSVEDAQGNPVIQGTSDSPAFRLGTAGVPGYNRATDKVRGAKTSKEKFDAAGEIITKLNRLSGLVNPVVLIRQRTEVKQALKSQGVSEDIIKQITGFTDDLNNKVPGFNWNGITYIISDTIGNEMDLIGTWLHEMSHTQIRQEYSISDRKKLYDDLMNETPEFIDDILPKGEKYSRDHIKAEEAMAYGIESLLYDNSIEDILEGKANIDHFPLSLQNALTPIFERFAYGNINYQNQLRGQISRTGNTPTARSIRQNKEGESRDGGRKGVERSDLPIEQAVRKIIGKKGAASLDRAEETNRRMKDLAVAEAMETAGKDAKTIRMATGWERGVDSEWRYEIPDLELTDRFYQFLQDGKPDVKLPLAEAITDTDLLKAYPSMEGDTSIVLLEDGIYPVYWDSGKKTINFSLSLTDSSKIVMKSYMLHEIQHAIQDIEGFAQGGPVVDGAVDDEILDQIFGMLPMDKIGEIMDRNNIPGDYMGENPIEWLKSMRPHISNIDDSLYLYNVIEQNSEDVWRIWNQNSGYNRYHRIAGEVEARNVQTRMGMTEEQRRNTTLEETEDAPRDSQIVNGVQSEKAESRFLDEKLESGSYMPEKIIVDGVERHTRNSNGQLIHPTRKGIENFWKWFGDSKVVDKEGKPLVVYHGTNADFEEFKFNRSYGSGDSQLYFGKGFYFTNDRESADSYSNYDSNKTMSVYLKIEEPYISKDSRHSNPWTQYSFRQDLGLSTTREIQPYLMGKGHDGVIHESGEPNYSEKNGEGDVDYNEYVVFSPTQIKSATGNNGNFDPDDNSVLFKRGNPFNRPNNNATPLEQAAERYAEKKGERRSWKEISDGMREFYKDIDLPLRRLQEAIKELGGKITDRSNPYRDMTLAKGRLERLYRLFVDEKMAPVLKTVSKIINTGVGGEEILPYVIAKHAIERNADLRQKDLDAWIQQHPEAGDAEIEAYEESIKGKDYAGVLPFADKKDGTNDYEGRPDELAQDIVEEFEKKVDPKLVEELWKNMKIASTETLKIWKAGNSLSTEEYNHQLNRYKFFVPLRDWREGAAKQLRYHKGSGFGRSLIHAQGRRSLAENPFAYIEKVAFKALGEQVDNEVNQAMLNLVIDNYGKPEFKAMYQLKTAYYIRTVNPITQEEEWELARDKEGNLVKPTDDQFKAGDVKIKVYSQHEKLRSKGQAMEHEVMVKQANQDVVIVFKGKHLTVAQALNHKNTLFRYWFGLGDGDATDWNEPLAKTLGRMNNWLKAMYTSYNIVFPLTNFFRDAPEASLTQYIKGESGADVIKNYTKSFPAIIRDMFGMKGTSEADKLLKRFYLAGGATGYTHEKTPQQIEKELNRNLRDLVNKGKLKGMPGRKWRTLVNAIESWNRIFEDATRLSVFISAIDQGHTDKDAASMAKEASVNFNRKGKSSKAFDSYWAFWNVALESMFKNFGLAKRYPKRFTQVAGGFVAAGFLMAMLNDLLPEDDDDEEYYNISDFVRHNYLLIPNLFKLVKDGNKGDLYLRIPLPQFWRGFYAAGALGWDVFSGNQKAGKAIPKSLSYFLQGLSPVDIAGFYKEGQFSIAPLVPTIARPIAEISENRDFLGHTISRVPFTRELEETLADAGLHKKNVNPALKFVTDMMYRRGGGEIETMYKSRFENGEEKTIKEVYDWNPSKIEHFIKGYTGGTGGVISDIFTTIAQVTNPNEELDRRSLPFINAFIRKTPEAKWKVIQQYYDLSDEFPNYEKLVKKYEKNIYEKGATQERIDKFKETAGDTYAQSYVTTLNQYESVIDELSDNLDMDTAEGSEEILNMMQEAIKAMDELKKQYNKK